MDTGDLAAALASFLRNPSVRVCVADEVEGLREELSTLQRDYNALRLEYERLSSNYKDLTIRCLDLQDILREHGVKWR